MAVHRMKIYTKYIDLIKENIKQREYRLFDEFRQNIKIGDTLLLISNEDREQFAKVVVNGIQVYKNWEEALKKFWMKDFGLTNTTFEVLLKECQGYYSDELVKKYGIVVFDISPIKPILVDSRVLLDTNMIIYRESHRRTSFTVATLYNMFDKIKVTKLIHPRTIEEIEKYHDEELRDSMLTKIISYQPIIPNTGRDEFFESVVSKYRQDYNSEIDNNILYQVYSGVADFLVTNDKTIIKKAQDLYLTDRVFAPDNMLKLIEQEYPKLISYDMLSVQLKKFGQIDITNEFFESLKEDYENFEQWFIKKNNEDAYVFEEDGKIIGFLYLKIEDINENYYDIEPVLTPKKRLKIGTFKIIRSGFRLSERFLKIIFDNALKSDVDEIYVTLFEDKRQEVIMLKEFMMQWGFLKHGYKKSTNELVLTKEMKIYNKKENPKFNFPLYKSKPNYFILPIDSEYHTDLFPDSILKNENMSLYKENLAHRYSLEKIYVCSAYNIKARPGDLILIYRSGDRYPRRYSSVISGMAILQNIVNPKSLEEYLNLCKNKSVFDEESLKMFYNKNKWRKVVQLLYLKPFNNKIILQELYDLNIIEKNKGPRPFHQLGENIFQKLINKSEEK